MVEKGSRLCEPWGDEGIARMIDGLAKASEKAKDTLAGARARDLDEKSKVGRAIPVTLICYMYFLVSPFLPKPNPKVVYSGRP